MLPYIHTNLSVAGSWISKLVDVIVSKRTVQIGISIIPNKNKMQTPCQINYIYVSYIYIYILFLKFSAFTFTCPKWMPSAHGSKLHLSDRQNAIQQTPLYSRKVSVLGVRCIGLHGLVHHAITLAFRTTSQTLLLFTLFGVLQLSFISSNKR